MIIYTNRIIYNNLHIWNMFMGNFVGVVLSPNGSSEGSKIPCSVEDNLAESIKI